MLRWHAECRNPNSKMPNKGLNSNVGAVIKFMQGKKTSYDMQERYTETQTENSSSLHWQTHITSQKYLNQRHGHRRWKQDPETSSDSTSLHLRHLQPHREKTYPQTQTINYPNGHHWLQHSYLSYTRPATMNSYQILIYPHLPLPAPFASTKEQTQTQTGK